MEKFSEAAAEMCLIGVTLQVVYLLLFEAVYRSGRIIKMHLE